MRVRQPRARLPCLASILAVAEGPLTLQKAGGGGRLPLIGVQSEDEEVSNDEEDDGARAGGRTIFYWREWLEKFLDSLWVTTLILLLLMLDISMFFAVTVNPDLAQTTSIGWDPEDVVTVVVTVSCLVDLTLRQVVQGVRFWEDKLSIAYFLVRAFPGRAS